MEGEIVRDHPAAPVRSPGAPDFTDLVEQLGDPALVEAVVDAYLTALPERLSAIAALTHAPDEEAVRAAHSLRSASALLGLSILAEACGALETGLRAVPAVVEPALVGFVLAQADLDRQALEARSGEGPDV